MAHLEKFLDAHLDPLDTRVIASVYFRRLAIRAANEIAQEIVLPIAELYGGTFAIAGIVVCGNDSLVARMKCRRFHCPCRILLRLGPDRADGLTWVITGKLTQTTQTLIFHGRLFTLRPSR